jgi:uncharacterized protein YciI
VVPERLSLLSYTYVPGIVERRAPHRDAHLELIRRYRSEGRLRAAGAVGDPPHLGLLAFATTVDAETFMSEDPYAKAGLIEQWRIDPWTVVSADLRAG